MKIVRNNDKLTVSGCKLIYTNFVGRKGPYNDNGDRSFKFIVRDPLIVADLRADGIYVKEEKKRRETDPDWWTVKVNVNYNSEFKPRITQVTEKSSTPLDEGDLSHLDSAAKNNNIKKVKFTANLFNYNKAEKGTRGYVPKYSLWLETMKVFIEDDWFEDEDNAWLNEDDDDDIYQAALPIEETEDIPF